MVGNWLIKESREGGMNFGTNIACDCPNQPNQFTKW
jgi:hypothetical protein